MADPVVPTLARRALLRWYRRNGRHDLPWRQTADPWHILLAELMLQRTRADLVSPVFIEVTNRWPSARDLSAADPAEFCEVVRPLGLTHRFARLQAAAEACERGVPRTYDALLQVPGVGRYVATATMCIAFGRRMAVVDPAVIRYLERFAGVTSNRSRPRMDEQYWSLATQMMPGRRAREWNFAVLDLSATVCRPAPRCQTCPMQPWCPVGQGATEAPTSADGLRALPF